VESAALKERFRAIALEHEYDLAGFAPLAIDAVDQDNLKRFSSEGYSAAMEWFGRHLELRRNPAKLFPGAESALVLGTYYRDQEMETALDGAERRVSRYAGGRDYHRLLRKKGKRLLADLMEIDSALRGRIVVDSAPVPEKILARMAGLGWQGKHTNLIHPEVGSYFFLSVLLLNREFPADGPQPDLCGQCRLCLDACPTGALFEAYKIDAGRCISYLTIERDAELPIAEALEAATSLAGAQPAMDFEKWVFGCDICQEVCPYNRNRRSRNRSTREAGFQMRDEIREFMRAPDDRIPGPDDPEWETLLRGSPLGRAGSEKLGQNIDYARNKTRNTPD
jgi:epoxyqueuosine reductase